MSWGTSDTFIASGVTCNFNVLRSGRGRSLASAFTVRHVPGGDVNIINRGGKKLATRALTLYVPSEAEMGSLEACVDESGTLTWAEGTYTATLTGVDSGDWWMGGQQEVKSDWLIEG
jgi:hypothetical protein